MICSSLQAPPQQPVERRAVQGSAGAGQGLARRAPYPPTTEYRSLAKRSTVAPRSTRTPTRERCAQSRQKNCSV
jgi:hypothetical protein